jgi:methylenetetrahydrofolate--tRNA-(uracil-5-)-methyltransferase
MTRVTVIGAGLAGSEAAWQCARRGIPVRLVEMKPLEKSPAHSYDGFAELVCSNSLRSNQLHNAVGLLKEELRLMGSLVLEAADATKVEAGGALAVDRTEFSDYITRKIKEHPLIEVVTERADGWPSEGPVIIATGPLTDGALAQHMNEYFGGEPLSFYDAAAPLIAYESIDMEKAFVASRYEKEGGDYINCPMEKDEYMAFWEALCAAEEAPVHGFEDSKVFEGCMPVEAMAKRGEDALRFGPMKPVGLVDPRTGRRPYAVVQLRKDNAAGSVYNMVGFQTHLKFPEQKRVFSMIPGLENAEFLRYGVMHRNTFIDSPRLLDPFYRAKKDKRLLFAGQMTGVEGYVESTASGLYAGTALAISLTTGELPKPLSNQTATGALASYISNPSVQDFQPMNINFGIINGEGIQAKGKKARIDAIVKRALAEVSASDFATQQG